jgi:hypothetical protein
MESIHLCAVFLLLQPDVGPNSASAPQYPVASNKEPQLRVEQCQKLLADIPLVSSPKTRVPNVGSIADLHVFLFCQPVEVVRHQIVMLHRSSDAASITLSFRSESPSRAISAEVGYQ